MSFIVGYECCMVAISYGGDHREVVELPLCWYCGKGSGEPIVPLCRGMDHPVYSLCKLNPSGVME